MDYPISLDTALQMVGSMKVRVMKKLVTIKNEDDKKKLEQELDMYLAEERILYGGDKFSKLSIMDKIINYYSPLMKKLYGFTED